MYSSVPLPGTRRQYSPTWKTRLVSPPRRSTGPEKSFRKGTLAIASRASVSSSLIRSPCHPVNLATGLRSTVPQIRILGYDRCDTTIRAMTMADGRHGGALGAVYEAKGPEEVAAL